MDSQCSICQEHEKSKPNWGPGPWQQEPNRVEFEHADLPCVLHRGPLGQWCGYAAVPPGHPCYELGYDRASEQFEIDAHGGLTYAEKCGGHICHVPKPGEPDNVWWFGFDCAHAGDYYPASEARMRSYGFSESLESLDCHYWTMEEARKETEFLAEQLAAIQPVHTPTAPPALPTAD